MSSEELARAMRGVADAYRTGWAEGYFPWLRADGQYGSAEVDVLFRHEADRAAADGGRCPCTGCSATGAYLEAAEATSVGDHERAVAHQRVGDAWFLLNEAVRRDGRDRHALETEFRSDAWARLIEATQPDRFDRDESQGAARGLEAER